MVRLTIDGSPVEVKQGSTILEACEQLGIEIPLPCAIPQTTQSQGSCRMCVVEVEGARTLQISCATSAPRE